MTCGTETGPWRGGVQVYERGSGVWFGGYGKNERCVGTWLMDELPVGQLYLVERVWVAFGIGGVGGELFVVFSC